jgi:hypothetical protein
LILADTNILVDVVSGDPTWADWSEQHLTSAAAEDEFAINDVVYAELSVGYAEIEALDSMLREAGLARTPIPRHTLFLAGKAFQRYRRNSGRKTGVLPDFFIGAHAVISDAALLTRDARRYRTYFPGIALIAPN